MGKKADYKIETHPKDRGCTLHPRCQECPEEICVLDYPGGLAALRKAKRNREIRKLTQQGVPSRVLAQRFGVHRRTINKAVKQTPSITGEGSYGMGHGRY